VISLGMTSDANDNRCRRGRRHRGAARRVDAGRRQDFCRIHLWPACTGAAKPNCDVDIFIVGEALKHIDVLPHLVRAENTMNRRIHISIYAPDEVIDKLSHRNAFHVAVMNQPKIMLIALSAISPQ
jgi:hypothetical protein